QVALVTGAASGIGKACVRALVARGAAVIGLDRDPAILDDPQGAPFLGIHGDVTDPESLTTALAYGVDAFGGLDILIANAGIFPPSADIASLGDDLWRRVMQVNLNANLALFRLAHPLLKLAPQGGRVVVVGSKNVAAPGPGVAAYSAA